MPPRNGKGSRASKDDKKNGSQKPEDYSNRRQRNNIAVKQSRVRSKMRAQQMMERVHQLKQENEMLEEKITMLTKELSFLKDLFLTHAGSSEGASLDNINLETLLADDPDSDMEGENQESRSSSSRHSNTEDFRRVRALQDGEALCLGEEENDDDNYDSDCSTSDVD